MPAVSVCFMLSVYAVLVVFLCVLLLFLVFSYAVHLDYTCVEASALCNIYTVFFAMGPWRFRNLEAEMGLIYCVVEVIFDVDVDVDVDDDDVVVGFVGGCCCCAFVFRGLKRHGSD